MKQFGGSLFVGGIALVAFGLLRLMVAKRIPGTADGEGGTDPFYLATVEHAYFAILIGAVVVATSIYCLSRARKSL